MNRQIYKSGKASFKKVEISKTKTRNGGLEYKEAVTEKFRKLCNDEL
jgi:hypothetical protein